jgi:hypothetical protein
VLKIGGIALTGVLAVVAAASVTGWAAARDDPCHATHTCPADDHSYVWAGMSCTSHPDQRLPEDQLPVVYDGVTYWCHVVTDQGMTPPQPKPPSSDCVAEREAVRTLTDAQAARVDLKPRAATVRRLLRVEAPASVGAGRGSVSERRTYRVVARVVAAQLRGSEWELTIADPSTGATLVAGLPAAACTSGASPAVRSRIARARLSLVRRCGLAGKSGRVALRGTATLEGVGFFPARAKGSAETHLQLRPLLSFSTASCA